MNSKQKILFLHSSSDLYGASKILVYTILSFVEAGHNVKVVLSEDGPLVDLLLGYKIDVQIIKLGILRRKYFNIKGIINRYKTINNASKELTKIVKTDNINVIYSNTVAVLVGALVAKKTKTKHIWHIHEIIEKPKFFPKIIGYLLKKAYLIIVVSNQVKIHWQKVIREHNNIKVIYNGLDYSPFMNIDSDLRIAHNIPKEKILIGMIARVNNWKGQKYFIEVASLLLKRFENLHFIMAGDAYPGYEFLYDEIKQLKNRLHVEQHFTELGFRKDVPNILSALDIFILPSVLPDPLPTVILEAMASAKTVAATAHGGAVEMVVQNETGILIPWDNANKAAALLIELIENGNYKEMGLNGRKRVLENFSLDSFKKNIVDVLAFK